MLHEVGAGSAARACWGRPVLASTLARLGRCEHLDGIAVLCRDDQHEVALRAVGDAATVVPVAVDANDPELRTIANAQRWADGWRGGLLGTTPADAGWHAEAALAVADATDANLVVPVPASFALIDPTLVDRLLKHASSQNDGGQGEPVFFLPTPPGLCGLAVTREHVETLAAAPPRQRHPGRVLHYLPDAPRIDPIGLAACPGGVSPLVSQSVADFRLETSRSTAWAELSLRNADSADAETLCQQARSCPNPPRDASIDLVDTRTALPIWQPKSTAAPLRPDVVKALATRADDGRLTLAGRGDPLRSPDLFATIQSATEAGLSVHLETDLLDADAETLQRLATSGVAVVSVHVPAMTSQTYASVMGVNAMATALRNLLTLHALSLRVGGPIVVPTLVKVRQNVAEMEAWYDHWLRACGAAVIRGPDFFANEPARPNLATAPLLRTDRHPLDAVTESPLAA